MRPITDPEPTLPFRHDDPVMDEALDWFLKRQSGEADPSHFAAWLDKGPDCRKAFERVQSLWDCPALTVATARAATASASTAPLSVPAPRRRHAVTPMRQLRRFAPAALAASLLLAAAVKTVAPDWWLTWQADYHTAAGEITAFDLPDGSRIELNSRTFVALDFDGGRRGVTLLQGEAWFEVAHDAAHPFTVTGGFGTVHVTGTRFDVARESREDVVHLESGSVHLTHGDDAAGGVAMLPGQTAAVSRSRIGLLPAGDVESRLAWREGWIQLSGMPLGEALAEIARHSGSRLVTLPSAPLHTPVSGSFRITEAEAALESVATAAGARIDRLPGGVLIIR